MNVFLHFIDAISWPENLRFYLSADTVTNKEVLNILSTTEYPLTTVSNRISVLEHLTNQLLETSAVREDLANEGQLPLEDHCRVCHRYVFSPFIARKKHSDFFSEIMIVMMML